MAINSSGIRYTSRVLGVSKITIIKVLQSKEALLLQVNPNIRTMEFDDDSCVRLEPACEIAELDENGHMSVIKRISVGCGAPLTMQLELYLPMFLERERIRSICFSKIEKMHDIVIRLLINALEFGVDIYAKPHI